MGSFQQVVMGGICLVAAFWFGSYINEQPDALQQPLQGIKNAFVNAGNSRFQVPPQLAEKPQSGLLSSFVDAPAKPHSITLSDLKSRSTFTPSNVVAQNSPAPLPVSQGQRSVEQLIDSTTEVVSDFVNPPTPDFRGDPSFTSNNYNAQAVSNTQINQQPLEINYTQPRDQQRLEIVPDFSTLAENFKREQAEQFQRNRQLVATPAAAEQPSSMLPVPKLDDFSRTSFGNSTAQPNRDWNAVRQGVMSVQEKLKQFHNAHPVAEEFEPLRAVDPGFPVAATTTSGRFIPAVRSASDEADRLEAEQLEASLQEYERQELARQEAQRQEFLRRRPQADVPRNQLRTEGQFRGRDRASEQRFETSYGSADPESFAQRQERWKVFGDRTQASQNELAAPQRVQERSAPPRPRAQRRTADVSSIPEESRVRSLYNMPLDEEVRLPQRTPARQEVTTNRNVSQSQSRQQRVNAATPLANDTGPEVIRYGDFKTYRTESGDTLQTISESFFGTPEYYFDLYLANRNVLANPATVPTGVELRIPHMGE